MPVVSTFYDAPVYNFGALTTTFTADPSCATRAPNYAYASSIVVNGTTLQQTHKWAYPNCNSDFYDGCVPSASSFASVLSIQIHSPAIGPIQFFSPGYICPSGWVTYGVAAHQSTATDLSLTGVFKTQQDIPMSIIGPAETLVACCPSAWQADLPEGNCYSQINAYISSEACYWGVPEEDITVVNGQSMVTDISPLFQSKTSYNASDIKKLTVMTVTPIINLIYQATDLPDAGGSAGLSQAAKIGIGIGVAVAVILLGGLSGAYFLSRRRRAKRQAEATTLDAPQSDDNATKNNGIQDPNSENKWTPVSPTAYPHSATGPAPLRNQVAELDQTQIAYPMSELPVTNYQHAVELPTGQS